MSKDYYKILGVTKTASAEEIKKAFRALAHQHHPDKQGGNAEKFKEINEAYQVLGDDKKRKQYDQFGSDYGNYQNFGGASGFNWQDFAQGGFQGGNVHFDMGDLGDLFGDFFGMGGRSQKRSYRGEDIEMKLDLEFREAVFGISKKITINSLVACAHCSGTGGEPKSELITCATCKGSGQVVSVKQTFLGNVQTVSTCGTCDGRGQYYSKKCSVCGGQGRKSEIRTLSVDIPAGIENGTTVKLTGQGNAGQFKNPAGDLYLTVKVKSDDFFERRGATIYSVEWIPFSVAVLGGKIEVQTIDGKDSLKIPAGTESGTIFTIKGKGAPRFQKSGRGDHEIRVEVQVPKHPTKEQKELLNSLGEAGL